MVSKQHLKPELAWFLLLLTFAGLISACEQANSKQEEAPPLAAAEGPAPQATTNPSAQPAAQPDPQTNSPIGKVDFRNYAYPMPRGWQGPEDKEVVLEDGVRPIEKEKIGVSYAEKRFLDVTGDSEDEAVVVLRIGTGGSSIPQVVYIYKWESGGPKLIWFFRTGDRADAGLKDLRSEKGELLVELFGQDRYIFGEVETLRIPGDEAQICCPTHFTQTRYKWSGRNFQMQGKRLTYSIDDPAAPPEENKGEAILQHEKRGKK